jgi:multidrug efflux pump
VISRFFIDRPIFATVLSIVIMLVGGIALLFLPVAQYPRITPPAVVISISYPGASSQVVADTVAAPIEQQVNGVPGMLYMSSQMGNDGTYSLTVTFDIGTDLKTALVMVQNRVTLAMPQLPTQVQNQGITIRKKTPDMLMIVNFFAPDGRYNDLYLSNFATINVKDELLRVEGVSDINVQGLRDFSIRVWLDPQKLASRRMTALDVAAAIRAQNLDAPAGQIGRPPASAGQTFQLPIDTLGRLSDPEQFGDIIVKAVQPLAPRPPAMVRPPTLGLPGAPDLGMQTSSSGTSGTMANSGTTSSAAPSSTQTLGTASTPGGASSAGGGTTTGGGATGGGATNSSPAVTSGVMVVDDTTDDGSMPGLSISGGTGDSLGQTGGGATVGRGPGRQSAAIVRLRDVARIELGAANYNTACNFDGRPSVGLMLYQLPGTNALDVADAVRKKMAELKTRFPEGLEYEIGYDTTPYIRESVMDVVSTMLQAVALVGLVVLVFLQDWKAMILPMIDVPVSIIGTFAVMAALGFSLNNISLFGLVLAVGIVVDDAIVVLENIERLIATGLDVRTATVKAMEEVTGPIVAVALVLCAVFVPCAFIGGMTGQFYRQFAVTISVSTIISAINAVTMTPSRAVLIFKKGARAQGVATGSHVAAEKEALPWWGFLLAGGIATVWWGPRWLALLGVPLPAPAAEASIWSVRNALLFAPGAVMGGLLGWFMVHYINRVLGWLFRGFNAAFDWGTGLYGGIVGKMLHGRLVVLVLYGALLALTWWAFQKAPTGFVPQQDQGRLIVNVQLPDSASLERTKEAVAQIDRIARETKGVAHTVSFAGMSFILQASSPNFASMFMVLDPFDKRQKPSLTDQAIMARLRTRWAEEVKEAVVTVYGASPVPGIGSAGGFKLVIEDRGDLGLDALQEQVDSLTRELRKQKGFSSVASVFRAKTPQLYLDIDRTKVAALGVALNDVNQTIDMYMGSLYVNSFNEFGRHWQVTVQAEGEYRNRVEALNLFQVRNKQGQMVPLGTVAQLREVGGPISVTRYNLYRAATINGNILTGTSTGDAIKIVEQKAHEMLPLSMKTDWTELMLMQQRAGNSAFYAFLLSIVCVFLALSALYESWTLPLAVILVVPLCMLCSVAGVVYLPRALSAASLRIATERDVNIFVQIGLVVLVGLACKNAILIVEYAKHLHQQGRPGFEATVEASRLRLRPILMTSFAFIFGVIPLVIASGAGAEMRRSLGTAVFSGMLGVTLFGIFLTPVFFYVIQGVGETKLFASAAVQWTVSLVLGLLLGIAGGYLLYKLGVVGLYWALGLGAVVGVLGVLAALGIHRTVRALKETGKAV